MEPKTNKDQANLNLPAPAGIPAQPAGDASSLPTAPGSQPPAPSTPTNPPVTQPFDAGQMAATASTTPDTPAVAEDNDLIEKEWVEKAKNIVDKTRDDPFNQNKQINQMKADYIKKRYNKDIKLSDNK